MQSLFSKFYCLFIIFINITFLETLCILQENNIKNQLSILKKYLELQSFPFFRILTYRYTMKKLKFKIKINNCTHFLLAS